MKKLFLIIILAVSVTAYADTTAKAKVSADTIAAKAKGVVNTIAENDSIINATIDETADTYNVVTDPKATWYEKSAAILGLVTALLALYEAIVRKVPTAKPLPKPITWLMGLFGDKKKGGGTH